MASAIVEEGLVDLEAPRDVTREQLTSAEIREDGLSHCEDDVHSGMIERLVSSGSTGLRVLASLDRDEKAQPDALHDNLTQPSLETKSTSAPSVIYGHSPKLLPVPQLPTPKRYSSTPVSARVAPEECTFEVQPLPLHRQISRRIGTGVDVLSRNVSATRLVPTDRCVICLENVASTKCVTLDKCGRDAHRTCTECLRAYFKLRIEETRVGSLTCPLFGEDSCEAKASERELKALLDPETMKRYYRYKRIQECPTLRSCPQCTELCYPRMTHSGPGGSRVDPEMTCEACGKEFCYYHSDAHALGAKACAAYEHEIVKKENAAILQLGAKKCPQCGVLTEKSSGCNHMTCTTCRTDWCWSCGKAISNVGWHYSPLLVGTCQQFSDIDLGRDHARLAYLQCITSLFAYPGAIVSSGFVALFLLSTFSLTFIILLLTAPLICCGATADMVVNVAVCITMVVEAVFLGAPFLVFSLGWAFAAVPIWVLLLPFGADLETFKTIVGVPMFTALSLVTSLI
eukprot:TRINITY_DN12595_c0_g8_i1.p1 TRINITY_DN12595_c0_g8~~TRINITY_DN12595_c0_g8_i1.p1  ORF type:complete len:514 (-),score=27.62 TRINITY_DN12595_c0_g8_i1:17-1558(-)